MSRPLSALDVTVDALAVARLTHLAQHDELWPVQELRDAYKAKTEGSRWIELAFCPFCLSVHMGVLATVARRLFPRAWPVAARLLAASYVTGKLENL